jgi:L-cysteate sulfo-lyase
VHGADPTSPSKATTAPDPDRSAAALMRALDALPRVRVAHLPTPLDRCDRLGEHLSGIRLSVKRDDATGMALGGNKTRQLEYVLGHALASGHDCVIQGAASQSNHARQLAAAGARIGLEVHLTPWLDARSEPVQGNFLLSHLYGATIHPVPPGASMTQAKADLAARLRSEGKHPYVVGMGAREALVLAAVAYAQAYLEIVEQMGDDGPPDWIFTPSQGSTQAGLLVGARWLGAHTRVIGICPMGPDHEAYVPPPQIHAMALDAAAMLGSRLTIAEDAIVNLTDYVGEAYGTPSPDGFAAMALAARLEGLLLDPVYTAKGFAGLVDHVRRGVVRRGESVVFVHTGGIPGVFAYADLVLANVGPRGAADRRQQGGSA